jgi:hypothetical protein
MEEAIAFVRAIKTKRNGDEYGAYYQLVKSERENGQVRKKVVVHLGEHPTVAAALEAWPSEIERLSSIGRPNQADKLAVKLEKLHALAS